MTASSHSAGFRPSPGLLLAGVTVVLWILVAFAGPSLRPFSASQSSGDRLSPPDAVHWLGTDVHGRDLFVRLCHGARLSLLMGCTGAGISLVLGVAYGLISGYARGSTDAVLMRLLDLLYALPGVILVIVLMTTFEPLLEPRLLQLQPQRPGLSRIVFLLVGIGSVSWLSMARIVRGEVLSLRERPYVLAAHALGAPPLRILRRHVLPNLRGCIVVQLLLAVPAVILYESFLSYLGLGIRPPSASLGTLIAEGASQINPIRRHLWLMLAPSITLIAGLVALQHLVDALRRGPDSSRRHGP